MNIDSWQAETNGGGLALWGSDGRMGNLRTSDEAYHKAWLPFIDGITKIIAANQITEGGVRPNSDSTKYYTSLPLTASHLSSGRKRISANTVRAGQHERRVYEAARASLSR